MNLKLVVFLGAAALSIVLLLSAFSLRKERSRVEAGQSALRVEAEKLARELAAAEKVAVATQRACDLLATMEASLRKDISQPFQEAPTKRGSLGSLHVTNPRLAHLWVKLLRSELPKEYGRFYQELALSSDEVSRLEGIMADKIEQDEDISTAAEAKHLEVGDQTTHSLYDQVKKRAEAEKITLLGEEGFRRLQEYERALPAMHTVNGLAAAVAFTEPLTALQADGLTQTIAQASARYREGGRVNPSDLDWALLDRNVHALLTPTQYDAWLHSDLSDGTGPWPRSKLMLQAEYDRIVKAEQEAAAAKSMRRTEP